VAPKGYGFPAILVIYKASILAILVINRVLLLHSCLELGMFLLEKATFFIYNDKTINKSPS